GLALCRLSALQLFVVVQQTAIAEIYTLSLHDALPILGMMSASCLNQKFDIAVSTCPLPGMGCGRITSKADRRSVWMTSSLSSPRSEEHTSELQSRAKLVCRRLLEKKETSWSRPVATPA